MRGVDKVTVFAVLAGVAAVSASCILDIDGVLARAAPRDGGVDAPGAGSGSSGAGTTVSTASSGGGGAMPATTTSSTGTGGSLPLMCTAGDCPPLGCVVEDGAKSEAPRNITAMVVAGSALFWMSTSGNKIWRRQLDQSSATRFAEGLTAPTAIAANAEDLFFADEKGIYRCSLQETNCTDKMQTLTTVLSNPSTPGTVQGLTATETELYWTFDANAPSAGSISSCSIADKLNCGTSRSQIVSGQIHPKRVVIEPSGTDVFWTSNGMSGQDGSVNRFSKSNPPQSPVLVIRPFPVGIALSSTSGTRLFWSEGSAQTTPTRSGVLTCAPDKNDCSSPPIIMDESSSPKASLPFDLALDAQRLYWTNSGAKEVLSCALPCTDKIKIIADGLRNPHSVVVHEPSNCVFFADGENGGRVLRQARP